MEMKKNLFILIILLTLLQGCKKYPDDPFISFASPRSRIEGDWLLQKVTINGDDSTAVFFANAPCGCDINFDESGGESAYIGKCPTNYSTKSCGSKFTFDKNKNIVMQGTLLYPEVTDYIIYEILELYKYQLKLRAIHPNINKEYIFEYKKKK